jgi:diadenosine tetraphosphatase ApaH/serine/threonine PP2A family protein phosphatase
MLVCERSEGEGVNVESGFGTRFFFTVAAVTCGFLIADKIDFVWVFHDRYNEGTRCRRGFARVSRKKN